MLKPNFSFWKKKVSTFVCKDLPDSIKGQTRFSLTLINEKQFLPEAITKGKECSSKSGCGFRRNCSGLTLAYRRCLIGIQSLMKRKFYGLSETINYSGAYSSTASGHSYQINTELFFVSSCSSNPSLLSLTLISQDAVSSKSINGVRYSDLKAFRGGS